MPNGFGAVLSAMLITMFSFMGAEIVTIAAAESDTPENILSAPPTRLSGVSLFSICVLFCRCGINPVEYAGAESRWFLSLGTGIAQYSSCEINHGLRDVTFRNQLPELGAVYRFRDALLLSRRGDAPAVMGKINRSKTPYVAVLLHRRGILNGGGELLRACEGV